MIRFACSIVFWMIVAVQCVAQEGLPRLSFLPTQLCDPVTTGNAGTDAGPSTEEIQKLLADLPRGRERDIALQLLKEVSVRRLPGFCRDPRTGEFVADSGSESGTRLGKFRVTLGNRSQPEVGFDVASRPEESAFDYAYRVSNGTEASAPIVTWGLLTSVADPKQILTHPLWPVAAPTESDLAAMVTAQESTQTVTVPMLDPNGIHLSRWRTPSDRFAIRAGSSLSQFAVRSEFRPGWTTAYIGSDDAIKLPQQPLPQDLLAGLEVLSRPEHYYTQVLTVGPKFEPGTSRAWIAGDWHLGVQVMIADGQLSAGSPYVAELLGSLAVIGASASDAQVALRVRAPPRSAMEALVDKAIRLALR